MARFKLFRALALLIVGLALAGCGPTGSPQDASAAERAQAARRLTGNWVLVTFQPERTLEPMLASLLMAQFGNMLVQFDGQQMVATGTGVSVRRRYRVTQALNDRLAVVTYDESGIAYEAVGEFKGNELWFQSQTDPWRGRGVLRRTP